MRRRLMYWYAKLKALEASFDINANAISLTETKIEIERIEDAVSHVRFPLTFTDQLYNLRSHIDIVRRKIASRANTPRVNGGRIIPPHLIASFISPKARKSWPTLRG